MKILPEMHLWQEGHQWHFVMKTEKNRNLPEPPLETARTRDRLRLAAKGWRTVDAIWGDKSQSHKRQDVHKYTG